MYSNRTCYIIITIYNIKFSFINILLFVPLLDLLDTLILFLLVITISNLVFVSNSISINLIFNINYYIGPSKSNENGTLVPYKKLQKHFFLYSLQEKRMRRFFYTI